MDAAAVERVPPGIGRPRVERMIVLIDNYDSFTFNLVHYLGGLGADVVVHRNDKVGERRRRRGRPRRHRAVARAVHARTTPASASS